MIRAEVLGWRQTETRRYCSSHQQTRDKQKKFDEFLSIHHAELSATLFPGHSLIISFSCVQMFVRGYGTQGIVSSERANRYDGDEVFCVLSVCLLHSRVRNQSRVLT